MRLVVAWLKLPNAMSVVKNVLLTNYWNDTRYPSIPST